MRKLLLASAAISALTYGAFAQEAPVQSPNAPAADQATDSGPAGTTTNSNIDAGVGVGGAAGAVTGAIVGGPVGAVIGGFAGAAIGASTAVPQPAVDYVVANPVDPVAYDGTIAVDSAVPTDVALAPIPDYPDYEYAYIDGRPVIIRKENRQVVYSPGYVVSDNTVAYVEGNPLDPVVIDGDVAVGTVLPPDVQLVEVPSDPGYSYVYTDTGPLLVNRGSRTVVWVQGG
jgi:hypothetical protein